MTGYEKLRERIGELERENALLKSRIKDLELNLDRPEHRRHKWVPDGKRDFMCSNCGLAMKEAQRPGTVAQCRGKRK